MVACEGNEPFVFISYAHADKELVLPLIQGLQERNFRVWYDQGIEVGNEWPDFIAEHLEKCSCMVAFVSGNFGESNNCREELSFAKELEKTILVIYLEDRKKLRAGVRMRLSTQHSMNLDDFADHARFLDELAKAKALKPCLGETAVPAPVKPAVPKPSKPAESDAEKLCKQGEAHYDRYEYAEAIPLFRKAADQGYAPAQYYLGLCYDFGRGVQRDYTESAKWYRKAAEHGYMRAQYMLGLSYEYGGVEHKNMVEARKWYQKAAAQGHERAAEKLKTLK